MNAARRAIAEGLVGSGEGDPRTALLIDWRVAMEAVREMREAFSSEEGGPQWLHCFAAKGNPVGEILRKLHRDGGMGVEAASMGELLAAHEGAEIAAGHLVFDSPIKTPTELRYALTRGIFLNLDNFQELQRVRELIPQVEETSPGCTAGLRLGLRVNPQVGAGSLEGFSTGAQVSKFGVPIEQREGILAAFKETPQLNALHVHAGSQGMNFVLQVAAIRALVDLAQEINSAVGRRQVHILDVGGGLSVNFGSDEVAPSFGDYAQALRAGVPELFSAGSPFSLIVTEFGRAVLAKAGFVMCAVEYTKESGGRHFAAIHSGADLFVRTVYLPQQWPLRLHLLDSSGAPKCPISTSADPQPQGPGLFETDIVGPCCFSMDVVAHRRMLPEIEPGDFILVLDTGAYFHSSFSLYNSRSAPGVFLFHSDATCANPLSATSEEFVCVCKPQTSDFTLSFFDTHRKSA